MKRLLLLGGGHAHLRVLADLARARLPGWEVVLVTPTPRQIYSGMLPGWVAGHYALEQCGIDVARLAAAAGVRLLLDSAHALDADGRRVETGAHGSLDFDVLSLDVGSGSPAHAIPGAHGHATPIRPIESFVAGWVETQAKLRPGRPFDLVVLGAGLGGVELAFAAHHRGQREGWSHLRVHLAGSGATPLEASPPSTRGRVLELMRQKGMPWHGGRRAAAVEAGQVLLEDGAALPADACWLATGSAPHPWLADSGLATDAVGYVRVHDTLQCESHPAIFAAGDVASLRAALPKSGVYAVRAGEPLSRNLQAACRGLPLASWQPQARALYLVSTGSRHALAVWGGSSWEGRWVWRWKDWIDRKFVQRFNAGAGARP
ncbi:pyridine nucleotide-disulfide oxidoreductase [Caenimonas sedimenti]|uniref:Pyridine nucleotide-disulfide oxidoreductase n=1 Tax=Caenimonas sedimenti TaxID=2596921 RepID=A0A562ZTE6_9BURK|nr:FAD-dependent oxidoreductase [Caenimonas sedimenti]TWO71763.1 pyridine nucleotide-disulfide oxidoreductase [Caenimonas sedimenti]